MQKSWYLNIKDLNPWAYTEKLFTPEECEAIKLIADKLDVEEAQVGNLQEGKIEIRHSLRKNRVAWIDSDAEESKWIFRRLTDSLNTVNEQFWKFNLDYIEALQYTMYDQKDDHYGSHMDSSFRSIHYRKLSFTVQLDEDSSYEGGDLEISVGSEFVKTGQRGIGTVIYFPSFMHHRVLPVTEGQRRSLVGWVCGPAFK
jgi:PKHD-type hydroxylase